jgi:hypothetical protein
MERIGKLNENVRALTEVVEAAKPILVEFARTHPLWSDPLTPTQDPYGVHALLGALAKSDAKPCGMCEGAGQITTGDGAEQPIDIECPDCGGKGKA